jgi:hypothetical protein
MKLLHEITKEYSFDTKEILKKLIEAHKALAELK